MNIIPWRRKHAEMEGGGTSVAELRREVDRLFDRFWAEPWEMDWERDFGSALNWGPTVNVSESEDAVTIEAELPGMKAEDVDIRVNQGVLTISGQKSQTDEQKKRNYHRTERRYGHFYRAVELPSSVNPDKVDATFKNGVLEIRLAKDPSAKPKRVEIKPA
jgi:HSP20 family protein